MASAARQLAVGGVTQNKHDQSCPNNVSLGAGFFVQDGVAFVWAQQLGPPTLPGKRRKLNGFARLTLFLTQKKREGRQNLGHFFFVALRLGFFFQTVRL